jgi:hypothetical protein
VIILPDVSWGGTDWTPYLKTVRVGLFIEVEHASRQLHSEANGGHAALVLWLGFGMVRLGIEWRPLASMSSPEGS